MSRFAAINRISTRAWPVVRVALGVLLLAAAALKLAGRPVSALPQVGWFATPAVQLAVAEWEIVLGFWLLSGTLPAGAWLASIATFIAFAGVSSYLGRIGVTSCGCFGQMEASPWHAFAVDLLALTVLAIARPALRRPRDDWGTDVWRAIGLAAGTGTVLLLLTLIGALACGSPTAALARLRGERVSASPTIIDIGDGKPGESRVVSAELVNYTDEEIRIVSGSPPCSGCNLVEELPIHLAPGERKTVSLRVSFAGVSFGGFVQRVVLATDDRLQPALVIRMSGRVRRD